MNAVAKTRMLCLYILQHVLGAVASSLVLATLASAQTAGPGLPVIYLAPNSFMADGLAVNAYAAEQPFPNPLLPPDVCAGITNAFANLPPGATSVTVDARGFVGTQSCSSGAGGPIPSTANGRVLLGNATIQVSSTWVIPAGVEVVGLGALSTTIQATSGFVGSSILQMGLTKTGTSPPQWGVKIKELTVDCQATPSCTGIYNDNSEEGSMVEDVIIDNASAYGLRIKLPDIGVPAPPTGSPFASNSGPYRNILIQYPNSSTCSGSTTGVFVTGQDGGQVIRGLDNVSISGCGGVGISVLNVATGISNSTISLSSGGTGIKVGDASSSTQTHNVAIDNVYFSGGGAGTTGVLVSANASNVVATNVSAANGVSTLMEDDSVVVSASNLKIPGPFVGFYMRGQCNSTASSACLPGPEPGLATTAPFTSSGAPIPWQAPSGIYCGPGGTC